MTSSAEREGERLDAGIGELDHEPPIGDGFLLSDQLIQTRFDNDTVPAIVNVAAASRTRPLAVDWSMLSSMTSRSCRARGVRILTVHTV